MTAPRPRSITLNKVEGFLEVTWSDDLICRYALSQLREACPCVECRGGHQFMGMEYAPDNILTLKPKREYSVKELLPVGNYAVQPVWDDGHDSGIYTWDYLRYLCPPTEDER